MREFINIMDEEVIPVDREAKAHDAAMSAIYHAKANPQTHGHYNVFWYVDVDTEGTPESADMVRIVDLLELGLIIVGNHKNWRKVARHVVVYPFHEPLSEQHVLELLVKTILKTKEGEVPVDPIEPAETVEAVEDKKAAVVEGRGSIRAMLERAVGKKK